MSHVTTRRGDVLWWISAGKKLLTPQPRLRTGFFSSLEAVSLQNIQDGCTSSGVAKYGMPVGLDDKIKVDLVVIGSVAVDPTSGARLGKGEVLDNFHFVNTFVS